MLDQAWKLDIELASQLKVILDENRLERSEMLCYYCIDVKPW